METIACADAAEWESWLAAHHSQRDGVWLLIAKKGSCEPSVTASEAGDVALCYGWIDSHRKSHDDTHFLQKYTPRRRGSSWSRRNVDRAEALIMAGRMRPAGLAEIEAAKPDGRWEAAYESQRTATVPADLAAALARDRPAQAFFESLGRIDQYAVILRLLKARSAASRAAQLRRVIAPAAHGTARQLMRLAGDARRREGAGGRVASCVEWFNHVPMSRRVGRLLRGETTAIED